MDKCVVVVTEWEQGELTLASLECVEEGREVADRLGAQVQVILCGNEITPLAATLAELDADTAGAEARTWFLATFESLPFSIRLGSLLVVHGGFGVRMLALDPLPAPLRARALYGQPSRTPRSDGKPVRLYRWVNEIPSGMTVVIGHDPCCDTCLLERPGQQGGRALHIDSAAGKGGPLSAVETDRDGTILRAIRMSRESAETLEIPIRPFSPELVRVTTGDAAGTDAPDNASGKD